MRTERRREDKLLRTVERNIKGTNPHELVAALWNMGLLNKIGIERLYMVREVERRVRNGELKKSAMELVAKEMNCSFEKVRAAIYSKEREKV